MVLDVPTLIVVTIFIATMAGGLMLFSWLQNRAVAALLWWGAAYLAGAVGTALLGARGHIPDFWSINIANAVLLASVGLTWCGLRSFDSRPVSPWYAVWGSAVWLIACGVGEFYQSLNARIALGSAIAAIYAALAVRELWRSRHDRMLSRWLAMVLFGFHGLIYLVRVPLTWIVTLPPEAGLFQTKWLPLGIFEALFYTFGTAFMLLTMTKERAEARHKHAAFIDPLTGVPNRRGFVARAEPVLARCRNEARPVSMLLFDLDHFKRINDTFGHQAGDDILVEFCRAAQNRFGPEDVFARLGGEEFVCVLPGTQAQAAFAIAERIRSDFDAGKRTIGAAHVRATVSIGMANSADAGGDLTGLLGAADKALYQAKAKGRNRVEGRRPALMLVSGDTIDPVPRGAARE
ncbi:MAG: diguanylate cyclase [Rhizobiales bacterium]|nr:diguanylate cyclase [Hyphomicrobiales bacterium]